ncbi:MAG TPA: glycosyltransferase family 4 protein [Flavisolibacter sp.]|nr:glycosyltransferase family 4 protein [Flavisolibacter sp.]
MIEKKKIKILEGIRQGKIGGGESYLLSLVENLDKEKFEPVVLSFTDGPMVDRLRNNGIKTYVIHTDKPFDIRVWKKVKEVMDKENVDVVHAHGTRANSNMFWAAKQKHVPLIYTCHAWSFHIDQNPIKKKLRILGEQYLTAKADINICGSEANRNTGKELFGNFEAVIIHNSIDAKKFNPFNRYKDLREEMGFTKSDIVITSIARFTLQKQPLKLIEAFSKIVARVPHAKLLMVGDGEQKEEAIELIKKLGLQSKVMLQPFRQDVPELLASADIFVLPSLWEAFPIALLEAMSMGKAVIGTNVDGTPEIIHDKKNGILISIDNMEKELEEAMLLLCENAELRKKFQKNAIESIYNKYNVETLARKNEEIYSQLVLN